jgi:hypothetical protein
VRPRRVGPWIAGLALVVVAVSTLMWLQRGDRRDTPPPTPPAVAAALAPTPVETPTPAPTPMPDTDDTLVIRTGPGQCWVEVTLADGEVQRRLLPADAEWRVGTRGGGVDLLIGDGGIVEVRYQGQRFGPLGKPGEVVRTHVGPER